MMDGARREKKRVGRRAILGALLAAGCTRRATSPPAAHAGRRAGPHDHAFEVYAVQDLPSDPRTSELSGATWDASTRTLYAVQDDTPAIVSLHPDSTFRRWTLGASVALDLPQPLDIEGIALVPEGFVVVSEEGPKLYEVSRAGKLVRELTLPPHFKEARRNKSLESAAATSDGRYVFTSTEVSLPRDGLPASDHKGMLLRIARVDRQTLAVEEHAYLSDASPPGRSDLGVSDLAAIDARTLLVLERAFTRGTGNRVRVYKVSLSDAAAGCTGEPALVEGRPVLHKQLLVDVAALAHGPLPPARQPQPTPLLENYEGIAIGPPLPDGRASLVLVSDDNARPEQTARVLVLAGPPGLLAPS
ncbi:MAG: esterase-like activity of phytase family protein [Polyangiaceae bacterium]